MTAATNFERAALLALLMTRPENLTWQALTTEILNQGSAEAVWNNLTGPALLPNPAADSALAGAHRDLATWKQKGETFLSVLDDDYPAQLREIHQVPPFLFARGRLQPGETAVSLVGSRKASQRGLDITTTLAEALVERGLTVLSGLAEGVDTAAHTAAMSAGGRTVAIIGTGVTRYFPTRNQRLQDKIAAEGLVLSQFWPDAAPTRYTFPMRNAVMSGYGIASIIVEAGEHSGARIQARLAVEHGRPVILTDTVVKATQWGRELAEKPGVHVAASIRQVLNSLDEIIRQREELPELLKALAHADS